MAVAEFFRRQAAKCLRLSRTSFDMETSRQLRLMAAEFTEKADNFEAQDDYVRNACGHAENGNMGQG